MTAFLAFVGGVIAVSLKGWLDYTFELRRERTASRAVGRLARAELASARVYLSILQHDGEWGWWRLDPPPFRHPIWNEHRYLLASALDYSDWGFVLRAYSSLDILAGKHERATRGLAIAPALDEFERLEVERHAEIIKDAMERLERIENRPLPYDDLRRVLHPRRELGRWRADRKARRTNAQPDATA